jgi:hypothetical protein
MVRGHADFPIAGAEVSGFCDRESLSMMLSAIGRIGRLMKMSLVIAPGMILGYVIGLPYGPNGVASAYSVVMTLWVLPLIA